MPVHLSKDLTGFISLSRTIVIYSLLFFRAGFASVMSLTLLMYLMPAYLYCKHTGKIGNFTFTTVLGAFDEKLVSVPSKRMAHAIFSTKNLDSVSRKLKP